MSASRSRTSGFISPGRGGFLWQAAVGLSGDSVVISTETAVRWNSRAARNGGKNCHCLDDL
jgi:hypothetical protein